MAGSDESASVHGQIQAEARPVTNTNELTTATTVAEATPPELTKPDIEHVAVYDDPRRWSNARKTLILAIISMAALLATLATNIFSPALNQLESDLHASDTDISTTISTFIIVQGGGPLFWSAVSEVKGRKFVYLVAESIFVAGCIIVGLAQNIAVVISLRCFQAFGSSAVFSVGAGTLADIFEPHERGSKMGIYYAAPLLGPSLGPIIGGALTDAWNWRATFFFLAAFCALSLASFLLFKDTFRRERSSAYQAALARHTKHGAQQAGEDRTLSRPKLSESKRTSTDDAKTLKGDATPPDVSEKKDLEAGQLDISKLQAPVMEKSRSVQDVKLTFRDINPFTPLPKILRLRSNLIILLASGILFAFSYSILYTCSRTFSDVYGYDALRVGLVLLSYGVGSVAGSILGGRWSDYALRSLKAKNGGTSNPEMRLESTKWAMPFLPLSSIAYAWLAEKHVHVAAVCVALFFAGFLSVWIYSSTLAYVVDANIGRSSTAVACNSFFRGTLGFVAAEIAVPLQDRIGDGGLYTLWGGLLALVAALIWLLIWKGKQWREKDMARMSR